MHQDCRNHSKKPNNVVEDLEINNLERKKNFNWKTIKQLLAKKPIQTKKIDDQLESAILQIDKENVVKNRQFRLFAYRSMIQDHRLKSEKVEYEQALFPSMNPNLIGDISSICSCKPEYRVQLNPGDVIFCFPQSCNYFNKQKPRKLTLIFIVIKKIELKEALKLMPFKSCRWTQKKSIHGSKTIQFGDITARYSKGEWSYAGCDHLTPHRDKLSIKSLNNLSCPYRKYLLDGKQPYVRLGCKYLKCPFYYKNENFPKDQCNMKSGNWKYDILFKWGLIGSLKSSIPLDFRSFYMGSKGWSIDKFVKELGNPEKSKFFNERNYKNDFLNKVGPKILKKLRQEYLTKEYR